MCDIDFNTDRIWRASSRVGARMRARGRRGRRRRDKASMAVVELVVERVINS